jgi:hypothetical protein
MKVQLTKTLFYYQRFLKTTFNTTDLYKRKILFVEIKISQNYFISWDVCTRFIQRKSCYVINAKLTQIKSLNLRIFEKKSENITFVVNKHKIFYLNLIVVFKQKNLRKISKSYMIFVKHFNSNFWFIFSLQKK